MQNDVIMQNNIAEIGIPNYCESIPYYSEPNSNVIKIMEEMISQRTNDELIELLCECEMLLQTNEIYLKKINTRGFVRLFNLILGIERKAKCRLFNNFQLLHSLTLQIQKAILKRIGNLTDLVIKLDQSQMEKNLFTQECLNFLMQKVNDHKTALEKMNQKLNVFQWLLTKVHIFNKKGFSNVKKILQATSDIYIIGVNPIIIYNDDTFETAMDELRLTDVQIHPTDFAKEIMQHTEYLPLYIKDELNYNDPECEISDYGRIVCRAYEMTFDFQIQELASAHGERMEVFCLPAIEKFVKEKKIATKSADQICKDLLNDVYKLRCRRKEALQNQPVPQVQAPKKRLLKKKEDKKMAIITAPGLWEYTPRQFKEKQLLKSDMLCFGKADINIINKEISAFKPDDIVVISDGIDIQNLKAVRLSLADFYCGYWIPKNNNGESEKYVAICEFHDDYWISLYHIPDTGNIEKKVREKLSWTSFTSTLQKEILHCEFFEKRNVDSHDVAIYRIFDDEGGGMAQKLDEIKSKKNDSKFVEYIDADWVRKLQDPIEQNQAIELLKNFKERLVII